MIFGLVRLGFAWRLFGGLRWCCVLEVLAVGVASVFVGRAAFCGEIHDA